MKKRYDTVALVGRLRRSRRLTILLSIGGAFVLAGALALYVGGIASTPEPMVPDKSLEAPRAASQPVPPRRGEKRAPPKAEPKKEPPKAEKEPARKKSKRARVDLTINKPVFVYLDGKRLGKQRHYQLDLEPGEHLLKVRSGKKTLSERIRVEAGARYNVRFDVRKGRAFVRKAK